jgi:hypothetical protein
VEAKHRDEVAQFLRESLVPRSDKSVPAIHIGKLIVVVPSGAPFELITALKQALKDE